MQSHPPFGGTWRTRTNASSTICAPGSPASNMRAVRIAASCRSASVRLTRACRREARRRRWRRSWRRRGAVRRWRLCPHAGLGLVVPARARPVRPGARRRRPASRSRHLRRGRRRADRAALPGRGVAAWRSRRRRRRDIAPLDDHFPPPATRGRGVRRHRLRHPALAQRGGCRGFRATDRGRNALADHRRTVLAVARAGHRATALARRTYPLPRRRKRGMGIGGLR
jgi:hypothetical protein